MMHMTFYWSKEVTLLFNSWRTSSWLAYTLTLFLCLVTSAFHQYMESRRIRLKLKASAALMNDPAGAIEVALLRPKISRGKATGVRVAGTILFGVNSAIGYLLMLAVMSFNGGVLVAVVTGLAIGYFLFRREDENYVIPDCSCSCA